MVEEFVGVWKSVFPLLVVQTRSSPGSQFPSIVASQIDGLFRAWGGVDEWADVVVHGHLDGVIRLPVPEWNAEVRRIMNFLVLVSNVEKQFVIRSSCLFIASENLEEEALRIVQTAASRTDRVENGAASERRWGPRKLPTLVVQPLWRRLISAKDVKTFARSVPHGAFPFLSHPSSSHG
eukprot:ANDGO_00669.mRNA.1 hypothetical protein